jgi:hypothetical protein
VAKGSLCGGPQQGLGRRGHDGGERAREHDGRDPGPTDQTRRNALDPHSRRGEDDETIELDAGDRPVEELPCQGEGGEEASFERKKPTDRARRGARPSKAVLPVIADGNTSPRLKKASASMLPDAKPSSARPTSMASKRPKRYRSQEILQQLRQAEVP